MYTRLVNCTRWRQVRGEQLQRQPFCEECQKQGVYREATVVHHRREVESALTLEQAEQLCYDPTNLESVCTRCHHKIHNDKKYHKKAEVLENKRREMERWKAAHQPKEKEK